MRFWRTWLAAVLAIGAWAPAVSAQPSDEQLRFFETRVRPVLAEHCLKCHGPEKQWSNFRIDSRAALVKGGDYGAAIVPGKPAESLLIQAVKQKNDDLVMPPKDKGDKLTERQIKDLETWIEQGAAFPETVETVRGRDRKHWAFQPAANPDVPAVKNGDWPQHSLDRFVLAKLEAAGLSPAPAADRRTLIRRATFDLTGLPPTPEEVADFLRDERPDAFARVVERLLASQSYGERWGRHWLDVARYADSNGLDENICHGNAWRYRDYVVDAFNGDKPYRQFVQEQVAGDLLPFANDEARAEQLIATGFLSIGPKVLAEVDETKMEMDVIDEQVDTVGKAFLGLTLGCARCHDHKFDPIDTTDYYALAGIFKSTLTMDSFKKIAKWHENTLPHEPGMKDPPTAMGVAERSVADLKVHIRGSHLKLGEVVPRHVPAIFTSLPAPEFPSQQSGRLQLAQWLTNDEHPLTYRVFVNRVWRWHFGKGLVRTTDNFGLLGEAPTHPELLDWLARRFVAYGTSIKELHRLIMLSSTYQQSSRTSAETTARDPDNRLWGRMDVRRLEAEAVRDSLLAVAGTLDRTRGGSLLTVKNREFFFDHTSKDKTSYDSRRRSLYLPVVRNHVYDVFQLLDYPDAAVSSGDRATTTIAPQALLMLNSELVQQASAALAERVLGRNEEDTQRIARLYSLAYGRDATPNELAAAAKFLADADAILAKTQDDANQRRQLAWSAYCQSLLMANEFIYVK